MTIYIVTEHVMNGTVTMKTIVSGIEAEDFVKAKFALVEKLLKNLGKDKFKTIEDTPELYRYSIRNPEFPVFGQMENKPLDILNE